jgi:D-alanine-D-alanine ligase
MSLPVAAPRHSDPGVFGRVAVLLGGTSAEREVSLDSGHNVLTALRARGVDAQPVDGIAALAQALVEQRYDRVFNVLHGHNGGGEDGVVQGLMQAFAIPYTGSDVLGSALSMDKVRTKQVWLSLGLPTPRYAALAAGAGRETVHAAAATLGLPVIVKPANEGSSVGISRVFDAAQLDEAVALAARYDGELLMEQLIEGDELTVAILAGIALPSIRIVPKGQWYDYNAKYVAEDTQYLCPGLQGESEAELGRLALGGQYRTGNDQSFAGAQGRTAVRHWFRGAGVAGAGADPGGAALMLNTTLRILAWLLAVALVALPVVAVLNGWVGAERWPLSRLRVTGDFKRVPAEQLRAVLLPYARAGYFAVKLEDAQDAIERLPWVASAQVRKNWPDVLEVRLSEHKPFARWGADRMLSVQGRLFAIPAGLQNLKLPQLGGPDPKTAEVVALYNESRALFAPIGVDVEKLEMDARGSWSLALNGGLQIVVGRDDARARLQRFARVLPQLIDAQHPVLRADLRYTNGFTIERQTPLPAPRASRARAAAAPPLASNQHPYLMFPLRTSLPGFTT